jgi:nitronate monooxygenase
MWPSRVSRLLGTRYPLVQAPMAGGFTTPELVAAVSDAGALGSLGGAMLPPDALRDAIHAVRSLTDRPFAVNLFAPLPPAQVEPAAVEAMQQELARYRDELGLPSRAEPKPPPPGSAEAAFEVVLAERPPVLSFTFGIPELAALKEAGLVLLGTATTVAEAVELERAGVDVVVAQSSEAGGHRGTFLGPVERGLVGGIALVPLVADAVDVPVVLAGGVMDGRGIAAALALGAEGVQLGTAFLAAEEAGTPESYRRAIAEAAETETTITRVYTGRHGRAVTTRLIEHLEAAGAEILPYPVQGGLLMDIRQAATEHGVCDLLFLLAGQASSMSRRLPAGELVATLVAETEAVLERLVQGERPVGQPRD